MLAINKQIRDNFLWEQGALSLLHQTIQWILILRSIELFVKGVLKNESLWWLWELLHSYWLELVLEWFKDRILQMRLLLHLNADLALVMKISSSRAAWQWLQLVILFFKSLPFFMSAFIIAHAFLDLPKSAPVCL